MTSVPGFGTRREAREDALAVLYEAEIAGGSSQEALGRRAVPPSDYAVEIALGVDADRERLDGLLRSHLVGWRLERLAVVDRALARMAAWELAHRDDVPTGVVLSDHDLRFMPLGKLSCRDLQGRTQGRPASGCAQTGIYRPAHCRDERL